jgi:hypothetical protein
MKPKNTDKKFMLNKETVVNLNQTAMNELKGGLTGITCAFCDSNISCYIQKCLVEFTDDNNCTTLPTQTRVETCP